MLYEVITMYDKVCAEFSAYMKEGENKKSPKIAYFSMEYGFNDNIKIFSGGLGILAGDYLKEASDTNTDIVGVGLLYRFGYFKQKITSFGDQNAEYIPQNLAIFISTSFSSIIFSVRSTESRESV